jgi:hypothetical protein
LKTTRNSLSVQIDPRTVRQHTRGGM